MYDESYGTAKRKEKVLSNNFGRFYSGILKQEKEEVEDEGQVTYTDDIEELMRRS